MPAVLEWVKSHPVEAGVGGAVVIVGALYVLGYFGGSSNASGGTDPNVAAYFGAQAAQAQSGNELAAIQATNAAQTAQAQIAADASVKNNAIWASVQTDTNATNVHLAQINDPYAVQGQLISTIGQIATVPGVQQGGSSVVTPFGAFSTPSSVVANPSAISAAGLLAQLEQPGFAAPH